MWEDDRFPSSCFIPCLSIRQSGASGLYWVKPIDALQCTRCGKTASDGAVSKGAARLRGRSSALSTTYDCSGRVTDPIPFSECDWRDPQSEDVCGSDHVEDGRRAESRVRAPRFLAGRSHLRSLQNAQQR